MSTHKYGRSHNNVRTRKNHLFASWILLRLTNKMTNKLEHTKDTNQKSKIYLNPSAKFVYLTSILPKITNSKEHVSFCGRATNNISFHPSLHCWSAPIQHQFDLSPLGQSTSAINIMFHLSVNVMHLATAIQSDEVNFFTFLQLEAVQQLRHDKCTG